MANWWAGMCRALRQPPAAVPLTAGDHALEVRFQATGDNMLFEFYWQPPGEPRELLPPSALGPLADGAWPAAERPDGPAPMPRSSAPPSPRWPSSTPAASAGMAAGWRPAGSACCPMAGSWSAIPATGALSSTIRAASRVAAWGSHGDGDGQFSLLSDIAVSADGVIAALDAGHRDVQLFDGSGKLIAHLRRDQVGIAPARASPGVPTGGFTWPIRRMGAWFASIATGRRNSA